jgi:NADH dehydrogenase (ubiquinone) flavoprotein 2
LPLQEDLTLDDVDSIIDALRNGQTPRPGPQSGRSAAEPFGGRTTLVDEPTGPGFGMRTDGKLA